MHIDVKQFKNAIKSVMKTNACACSINLQNIDTGTHAFANLPSTKVSWGNQEVRFYLPGLCTYRIPYGMIEGYKLYGRNLTWNSVEVGLTGRQLLSIRPRQ